MDSSLSPTHCPSCNAENSPDSRFCRHCGVSFEAPAIAPQTAEAAASSPAEIDARRARQLLDRAGEVAERGDGPGALLACRQAIALAPDAPGGYGLLGLLLERGGDLPHAVAAYEKAVQLAPESVAERESLERLRAKLQDQQNAAQQGAALFHFDDNELFEGTTQAPQEKKRGLRKKTAEVAAPAVAAPAVAADNVATAPTSPEAGSVVETSYASPNIRAAAPGLPAPLEASPNSAAVAPAPARDEAKAAPRIAAALPPSVTTASVPTERRSQSRRREAVPVTTEHRTGADRRALVGAARIVAPAKAVPISVAAPVAPRSPWTHLWANPSFYGRSLPLVATTVLALGFLSWARSMAVARAVANAPMAQITPAPSDLAAQNAVSDPVSNSAQPAVPIPAVNAATSGGFPVTNGVPAPTLAPAPANAAPVTASPANPAPAASARTPRTTNTAPRGAVAPPRISPQIPPAPLPPPATSPSNAGSASSGGAKTPPLILPAPDLGTSATAVPPVSIAPSSSNSGSEAALNPAGSSDRDYVRITRGRIGSSAVPSRSSARNDDAERRATAASSSGRTGEAINRLTTAINADPGGAGFRYQQRASLFLDRGDFARAATDFQSAISAYSAQIERGDQVASASAGLRAARSGLNAALAGGR